MAEILTQEECGLLFGTEVSLVRLVVKIDGDLESKVSIGLTGDKNEPIKLKFHRAGHNHWDSVYAYCFKLPSQEEFWVEMSDELSLEQRLKILKNLMKW